MGKVNKISLEGLRLSRPVQHDINRPKAFWEVLDEVHAALEENSMTFIQDDIYITTASSFHHEKDATSDEKNKLQENKEPPLANWTFDDLCTRILIIDELHEMEGTMLLAYNRAGIQLAFGLSYNERENVALLGEDETFLSTTSCGDIKVMSYFVMIHKVKQWFPQGNRNVLDQLERTKLLINKTMKVESMHKFVDLFYQYNLKYNDCLHEGKMMEDVGFETFVSELKTRIEDQFSANNTYSAWDLYSAGNSLLKPDGLLPLKQLIPLGYFWGSYVFSRLV